MKVVLFSRKDGDGNNVEIYLNQNVKELDISVNFEDSY